MAADSKRRHKVGRAQADLAKCHGRGRPANGVVVVQHRGQADGGRFGGETHTRRALSAAAMAGRDVLAQDRLEQWFQRAARLAAGTAGKMADVDLFGGQLGAAASDRVDVFGCNNLQSRQRIAGSRSDVAQGVDGVSLAM